MKTRSSSFSRRTSASRRKSATLLGHTMVARTLRRPLCPTCSVRAHRRPRRQQALLQRPRRQQALLQRPLRTTRFPGPKSWCHLCTQIFGTAKKEQRAETTWSKTERAVTTGISLRCSCGTSSHTRLWLTDRNAATSCSAAGSRMVLQIRSRPRILTGCAVA